MCSSKTRISNQINPQRSWTIRDTDLFRISKNIGLGVFQLELPEGWVIHNIFNEDLLTWCVEPKFKGQHKEPASLPTIINKEEEYEVEKVRKYRKQGRGTQYLMH